MALTLVRLLPQLPGGAASSVMEAAVRASAAACTASSSAARAVASQATAASRAFSAAAAAPQADTAEEPTDSYTPKAALPLVGNPATGVADDTTYSQPEMLAGLHTYPLSEMVAFNPDDPRSGTEEVYRMAEAVDDTNGIQLWQYDMSAGEYPTNYHNALLSDTAKDLMFDLHDTAPDKWTTRALAEKFQVREQRVMAIIALVRAEREHDEKVADALRTLSGCSISELGEWVIGMNNSTPRLPQAQKDEMSGKTKSNEQWAQEIRNPVQMLMNKVDSLEDLPKEKLDAWKTVVNAEVTERLHASVCEDIWRCVYSKGTGEHHMVSVPTFPRFESVPLEDLHKYKEGDINRVNRLRAAKEDKIMIDEFKENLDYNLLAVCGGIRRGSRINNPPGKPEEGWSLLVTPLEGGEPFVAQPDGSRRPLSEDEAMYHERRKPKRRRRIGFR